MMAKIQNDYYIEKVNTIREQLPKEGDPLRILRSLMTERNRPDITPELEFRAVHPEEVEKIIKQLKNTKSCGTDWVDTKILKLSQNIILPALTHLINLIITTGIYPKDWKIAKIIPLYKGKEARKADPKSYRPIALLPIISKVMERAIHNQIMEHMEAN